MRDTFLTWDNSAAPTLLDPTGASVSTRGTVTAGIQEAIACADLFGSPLIADGNQNAVIAITGKIKFPARKYRHVEFRGLDLTSSAPIAAIEFDTHVASDISWTGRLNYTGPGPRAIWENPVSPVPGWFDQQVIHKYNTIKFPFTIIGAGSGATIIRERNPAVGAICNNRYFGAGYNGGLIAQFGIGVKPPGAGQCDVQNEDYFGSIGACRLVGLQEGWGPMNPLGPLGTNKFFGSITCDSPGMICYYATFGILGQSEFMSCSINQGTVETGVIFNTGTDNNRITSPQIVASNKFQNNGGSGNLIIP